MKFLVVFIILLCLGSTGFMFIYFDSKIKKSGFTSDYFSKGISFPEPPLTFSTIIGF